jgi:hypothetical protein
MSTHSTTHASTVVIHPDRDAVLGLDASQTRLYSELETPKGGKWWESEPETKIQIPRLKENFEADRTRQDPNKSELG